MLCRVHCVACGLPTLDEDIKNIIVGMEAAYTQDSLSGPSSRPLNHMCQVKIHGMELFDPCECRNHVGSMFSSPATSKLGPLRTKLTKILPQFLAIEPHFVRKGCAGRLANRNFTSVFGDRTSFRAKWLRGTTWNRNFTSIFGDRTSFRAKGLRFVPSCWHCPCPRLQKRNRKEVKGKRTRGEDVKMWGQEGKRARGEDVKMWGCEDVKMWGWEDMKMSRCEDVKMSRCDDEKMWRCEDVKMRRCEDEKMWRWEDVKMRRCEDVKMRRCEDEKMRWRCEDEKKMWRWEDVKMRRCEDEKMRGCEDEKMWRWEDEKMRDRPPLLEEPCGQTLSGKTT